MFRGIVLAGGSGSRLHPFTLVTNKHLALVYDKPMIFYPLLALRDAGVKDILIITGGNSIGDFLKLLKSGKDWGMNFTFKVQDSADGIAGALSLSKEFIGPTDNAVVILGDNIYSHGLKDIIKFYDVVSPLVKRNNAMVILKKVENPSEYGVATFAQDKIVKIIEKPEHPDSNSIVTGCYIYPYSIFDKINKLTPSKRGELEITDINQMFVDEECLIWKEYKGEWYDAGTIDGILDASNAMQRLKNNGSIY